MQKEINSHFAYSQCRFIKKKDRLEHKRLHDLVYTKYNQQLAQRYNIRDEINPIVLNDID